MAASLKLMRCLQHSKQLFVYFVSRTNPNAQIRTINTRISAPSINALPTVRWYSTENTETKDNAISADETDQQPKEGGRKLRPIIDVETSIKYLSSKAYKLTYGDALVWQPYRRNHKGAFPPEKTRKTCIRQGAIATGNPCPICRDEYLVLHAENVSLLKQFISPSTGQIISYQKTGLCQTQHKNLLVVLQQAWDLGYINSVVPFRHYDYEEYYPKLTQLNGKHQTEKH